ncbi:MAG TPA: flippase-like domain-containing protein [Phycisphaerales bacterium]|nr:flippase-like domain-containing protein [Phycisphaerales bacterium]
MIPKSYKTIIQWVLAASCILYLVRFFAKNTEGLKLVLDLNPLYVLGIALLVVLGHLIFAWRYRIILIKCSEKTLPFLPLAKMIILSRFLGVFAPQAGNIYRGVVLKKQHRISYTTYASSFFSITWFDTCLNLIFALIIILAIKPELELGGTRAWLGLLALIILIGLIPFITEQILRKIKVKNRYLLWVHGRLSEMFNVSVSAVSDKSYLVKMVLTGVISFVNTIIMFYICFHALGISITLPVLSLFYVILRLCNSIQITPGNIGIREIAYGILSSYMQIGMAEGILVSVAMRIISLVVISVMGIALGGVAIIKNKESLDLETNPQV